MTEQQVIVNLKKKVLTVLNNSALKRIAQTAEPFILKLIQRRILSGYDLEGKKFGGYNASYRKSKAYNYVTSSRSGKYHRTPTEFAMGGKLMLSGQLMSNIKVSNISVTNSTGLITIKYKIFVPERFHDQVEGLQSTTGTARNGMTYSKKAWLFLGLSKQLGEQDKLVRYLIGQLRTYVKTGNVKTVNK